MTYKKKLVGGIAASVAGLLLLLCIIPQTRYMLPSKFVHKPVSLQFVDPAGLVVPDVAVSMGASEQKSDASGIAVLPDVPVGNYTIRANATFYEAAAVSYNHPLFRQPKHTKITLQPIGEITKVTIKNRITGRSVSGARIVTAQGGNATTNSDGVAILAMPKGVVQSSATVTGEQILTTVITVSSAQSSADNIAYVTPTGRVTYVQKNDNKLQVSSSNLDGTEPSVLLDGTGNEDQSDTQLIGSPSWKFAALKARRDVAAGLYILDVVTSKITTVENSGQSYIPVGWKDDVFVYMVYTKQSIWLPGSYSLKAFNALNQQTTIIDESKAEGSSILDYASEVFENVYVLPEGIVYAKKWQASYYYGSRLANKKMTITLSDVSGAKQDISQWQAGYNAYIKTRQTGPRHISIFVELDGVKRSFYRYQNKSLQDDGSVNEEVFKKTKQDTYFLSPNNLYSVWQAAEGGNYVGTVDSTVASLMPLPSTYRVVGWFTNDYILLQDTSNNDLKISARDGAQKGGAVIKISTMYPAKIPYTAYGYGR